MENKNEYLLVLLDKLSSPLAIEDFRAIVDLLLGKSELFLGVEDLRDKLLLSIREKIYDYVKTGTLVDNSFINLWQLYKNANLPKKEELDNFIYLFEKQYRLYRYDEKEKFIFLHLTFIFKILNGDIDNSLKWFLGEHIYFHGQKYHEMDNQTQALKDFFSKISLSFDTLSEAISVALQRYFEVSKEERLGVVTWILGLYWNYGDFENHPLWKSKIYGVLLKLFEKCTLEEHIEEKMSLHFLMSHIYLNRVQTQEEFALFNEEVEQNATAFYEKWALQHPLTQTQKHSGAKHKIAFLKDRIVENSPFKVEFSLLHVLLSEKEFVDKYEVYVYSMALIEKSLDDQKCIEKLEKLGVVVRQVAFESLNLYGYFQSHFTRALAIYDDMQKESIDTAILATNNFPIGSFLFAARCAPKQIFWSHGNFAYDIKGIDKRISHFHRENPYTYERFDVSILDEFHKPEEEKHKAMAKEIRKRWSEDIVVLGSIGRLVKMDNDEYISTIAQILKENPNTIYLACGSGHEESIKQKLVKYDVPMDRFFFEGFVNAHVYGYVIDVYLNTFPEPSGEAVGEFVKKGEDKFVVSLEA